MFFWLLGFEDAQQSSSSPVQASTSDFIHLNWSVTVVTSTIGCLSEFLQAKLLPASLKMIVRRVQIEIMPLLIRLAGRAVDIVTHSPDYWTHFVSRPIIITYLTRVLDPMKIKVWRYWKPAVLRTLTAFVFVEKHLCQSQLIIGVFVLLCFFLRCLGLKKVKNDRG